MGTGDQSPPQTTRIPTGEAWSGGDAMRDAQADVPSAEWLRAQLRFDNDPSAGSPTETLLRLLLPLNDKVQWNSRDVAGGEPPSRRRDPNTSPDHSIVVCKGFYPPLDGNCTSRRPARLVRRTSLANDTCLWGPRPLLLVGKQAAGTRVASSPDSDLEAFSHNPAHVGFPLSVPVLSWLFDARGRPPKRPFPIRPPAGTRRPALARGSSSSSPPTADGFGTGTPVPSPQSQSFSRGYGSILPTSLAYIVPSTRGCSPWRPDAVMSTTGRGRHSVLRIFKGRRGRTGHRATCGALPAAGPYLRLSRFQGGQAVKQKR
ncbi:hypothetical protein L6452_46314 [Arctium lappa]|nr:hypothetical protein L6452_46314 [Arctium lappa]